MVHAKIILRSSYEISKENVLTNVSIILHLCFIEATGKCKCLKIRFLTTVPEELENILKKSSHFHKCLQKEV